MSTRPCFALHASDVCGAPHDEQVPVLQPVYRKETHRVVPLDLYYLPAHCEAKEMSDVQCPTCLTRVRWGVPHQCERRLGVSPHKARQMQRQGLSEEMIAQKLSIPKSHVVLALSKASK